ncbi:hypothetical protein GCM10028796_54990 [Ramlibacter monticola]|uniref:Uncharacterized protein n=1 Tax=Ramlibacter monticola TaxID=1926872 RepID=A0A936Z4K1_9BURK|nr:hypothetical protein [Ramlibacter monticola]MBL0394884.1 hypothetical protein [Ramlibacter monticola]
MSNPRTASILQRVPAILAVTANSYGLPWQADGVRKPEAARERRRSERQDKASGCDKPAAH